MNSEFFGKERELQDFVNSNISFFFSDPKYFCFRKEVPVGPIIPDFVLIDFGNKIQPFLKKSFNYRDAYIFWKIALSGHIDFESLSKNIFEDKKFLVESVSKMEKNGIVKGGQKLSARLKTGRISVVAIEAKLFNWREALAQAQRYQLFSNQSIVVINESIIDESVVIQYRKHGIGLCGASKQYLKWYVKPKISRGFRTPDREYLILNSIQSNSYKLWSARNLENASLQPSTC